MERDLILNAVRRITAALIAHDAPGFSSPTQLAQLSVADPRVAFFLNMPKTERARVLTAMLDGDAGHEFRRELTRWIVQVLSVERLVPQAYEV